MTAIFKTPYFMYSFDLKWTVCVQICCTLFNLKGKKWFWVCVHIDEPPLISIRIDELQPHLLFLKKIHLFYIFFGHVFCLSCLP